MLFISRCSYIRPFWHGQCIAIKGWGMHPSSSKFWGNVPQELWFLQKNFWVFANFFRFLNISKIKWVKSEEKSEFGGRWLSCLSAFDESKSSLTLFLVGGGGLPKPPPPRGGETHAPPPLVCCVPFTNGCIQGAEPFWLLRDIYCRHSVKFLAPCQVSWPSLKKKS